MRWFLVSIFVLTLSVLACSDDDVGNPTIDIREDSPDTSGDVMVDQAEQSDLEDTGADDEMDLPEPGLEGAGWIVISSYSYSIGEQAVAGHSVIATFEGPDVTAAAQDTCTEREEGACRVTECHEDGEGSPTPTGPKPTAGALSVNGGHERVTLVPDDNGTYPVRSSGEDTLFDGGETLRVSGAGAEVPAFSLELVAPISVTLTTPEIPVNPTPWVVSKQDDLLLEWTGGEGTVEVLLFTPTGHVSCQFAADEGSSVVSSAAIQALTGTGSYSISVIDRLEQEHQGWQLTITASTPAETGSSLASGSVVFR